MRRNRIFQRNREGRRAVGCGLPFPCAEIVELVGRAGMDFVSLDGEHGLFSPEAVDAMVRAADAVGLTVTARVPNIDSDTINLFMDRGVLGIMGPHVDTPEQARALVDACRYAPQGRRSWGGWRGTEFNDEELIGKAAGDRRSFMEAMNAEVLVMAQIETVTAIENLDAILQVEGIDAFAFGPFDLAQSIGLPGQADHPDVRAAMEEIARKVRAAGRRMASDLMVSVGAVDLVLGGARRFVERHA